MKKLMLVGLMVVMASSAMAQNPVHTFLDLNTGVVPVSTVIDVNQVIVTAVRYNGFSATDIAAGPYTAAWVYTGGAPGVMIGDVVDLAGGTYIEYFDMTEYEVGAGTVLITGTMPTPYFGMSLADVNADDEAWENHVLHITDAFVVMEMLSFGEWNANSIQSWPASLRHDDYFFDETTLSAGMCYDGVVGLFTYSFGVFRINPFADGLTPIDCTIPVDTGDWSDIKTMYR